MAYEIKPFSLDPKLVKGISEKILISHYGDKLRGRGRSAFNAIAAESMEICTFAKGAPEFSDAGR